MISIKLTRGYIAFVDEEDKEQAGHRWYPRVERSGKVYAQRKITSEGKARTIQLHREILGITESSMEVDHRDGDGLNCCRGNLRVASHQENGCNRGRQRNNTSGFKGVCFYRRDNRYAARIKVRGKTTHLGFFATAAEAARAYDVSARLLHGEFSKLNFS